MDSEKTPRDGRQPMSSDDSSTDILEAVNARSAGAVGDMAPIPSRRSIVSINRIGDDGDDGDDNESISESGKLPYSKWRCIALVATVTGASFSNTLANQSVVIILPTIGREIGIPDSRQQWVISAYSLAFGCLLLPWGRIADVFGKKSIFVAGSAWVTAMTIINPFIKNEIAFDLVRGLQGLGAAANVPTAVGILGTTFPAGKAKNYAFAAYGAGAPIGSVCGNLIAGLITSYANWKWVFGVLAIFIGIITVTGFLVIPDSPPLPPTRLVNDDADDDARPARPATATIATIDWIGAFLITLGFVGLLFALTEGNIVGWPTPWVGVIIALSALLIIAFGFWQLWLERPEQQAARAGNHLWPPPPLLRMSIFSRTHNPDALRFVAALCLVCLSFSAFNGFLVYATYFYQDYLGLSAIQTTLRFIPTGVAGFLTCFCVAQLLSRVPMYALLIFGNTSICISCLLFAVPIPPSTSYFAYGLEAMVFGVFGADTTQPCMSLFVSRSLPPADQALGGALVNAASQIGRAISLAIATATQTAAMASARGTSVENAGSMLEHDDPTLRGLRAANWYNFGVGVAAACIALVSFRGAGIVGKVPAKTQVPLRSTARPAEVADIEAAESRRDKMAEK